jgi:hypothetical protein
MGLQLPPEVQAAQRGADLPAAIALRRDNCDGLQQGRQ